MKLRDQRQAQIARAWREWRSKEGWETQVTEREAGRADRTAPEARKGWGGREKGAVQARHALKGAPSKSKGTHPEAGDTIAAALIRYKAEKHHQRIEEKMRDGGERQDEREARYQARTRKQDGEWSRETTSETRARRWAAYDAPNRQTRWLTEAIRAWVQEREGTPANTVTKRGNSAPDTYSEDARTHKGKRRRRTGTGGGGKRKLAYLEDQERGGGTLQQMIKVGRVTVERTERGGAP